MNTVRKVTTQHRRHLKDGQIIPYTHGQKSRRGIIYTPYQCRVVVFEDGQYLRAEAGRVWFVPSREDGGFTYKKVTVTRNEKTVKDLEKRYNTYRHRKWRHDTGYKYVKPE